MKTCTLCKVPQDMNEFSKHPSGKGGRQPVCRSCNRKRCKFYRDEIKRKVFAFYGQRCACCGETTWAFLTLDHVHNDGAEHRRQLNKHGKERGVSGDRVWRELVKTDFAEADRFQILCYNCNCGKRDNGGVCPHQADDK